MIMTLRLSLPRIRWTPSMRITVFGLSVGVSMVSVLTFLYYRRRGRRRLPKKRDDASRQDIFIGAQLQGTTRSVTTTGSVRGASVRSRRAGSVSSRASTMRSSIRGGAASAANGPTEVADGTELTPEDCGLFGLKALRQVIDSLEDALYDFKQFDEHFSTPPDEAVVGDKLSTGDGISSSSVSYVTAATSPHCQSLALMQDLKKLLQEAYLVKERWKQKVILQTDVSGIISDVCNEGEGYDDDDDETESFVSASEFIDLSDLDALLSQTPQEERYLYRVGLLEIEQGNLSCRSLRTRLVGCETDSEYLAKVHCLRIAFDHMFSERERREWVKDNSLKTVNNFLVRLGYNSERFTTAFDNMVMFIESQNSRSIMSEELGTRGVKCVNFYDIALDFLLLDAFEELANPPSSLVSVINNRWLSNGFKKTALESAVWTILLTKRKFLKRSDGFIAHYYSIAAEMSPALAWGFLGPEEDLQTICNDFKDHLLLFVRRIFSFSSVRYTTVEDLTDDVFALFKEFSANLNAKLSSITDC